MTDTAALYSDLRTACAEVLARHRIRAANIHVDAILSYVQVRNAAIRERYDEGREAGVKSEGLLAEIAAEYDIEYETAYAITHGRR